MAEEDPQQNVRPSGGVLPKRCAQAGLRLAVRAETNRLGKRHRLQLSHKECHFRRASHVIICAGLQTQAAREPLRHIMSNLWSSLMRDRASLLSISSDVCGSLLPSWRCTACGGHLQHTGSGSFGSGWQSFSGVSLWSFLWTKTKNKRIEIKCCFFGFWFSVWSQTANFYSKRHVKGVCVQGRIGHRKYREKSRWTGPSVGRVSSTPGLFWSQSACLCSHQNQPWLLRLDLSHSEPCLNFTEPNVTTKIPPFYKHSTFEWTA